MAAIISKIREGSMGTAEFEMKLTDMRKPQDFIVYPIQEGEEATKINIQSDKRFGELNLQTGEGEVSKSYPNGSNTAQFYLDRIRNKSVKFSVSERDLSALKAQIFTTGGSMVGNNGVIFSDNSGAFRVL